ncbi:EAL domain-containing protein [Billgrantia sulfidoxydans]|uniref:EAL domain-containing protein n=1 Tax=Billgrantia sulfidoxydans TaxID=2733484 RepID=A0ABX7W5P7_9GAMM|nr:EAL domain-containing protein [Halomonas sulfidoxydans]QTP55624.1 EAL domain-containing protein [Halomonas sulfidoxydans]
MRIHRLARSARFASQHWPSWLLAYAALSVAAHLLRNPYHGFSLMLPQGGILLAALLVLPSTHRRERLRLVGAVLLVDSGLRIGLQDMPPLAALWVSAPLVAQAWLGALLLRHIAPDGCSPDTQRGILQFLLWGCLLPAALSSSLTTLGLLEAPGHFLAEWLWWFIQRLNGLLLFAPLLVLVFRPAFGAATEARERPPHWESVALWALTCLASALIFSVSNPAGRTLATYSFLLTPLLVIVAIRLPLTTSLFVVLSASLVASVADALGAGDTPASAQRSLIAVSVFLLINQMVVWLLGALIDERHRVLRRVQKMRDMYEMLSNANQALINLKLTPPQLYQRMCEIIVAESDFYLACITPLQAARPGSADRPSSVICARQGSGLLAAGEWCHPDEELVHQAQAKRRHVIRHDWRPGASAVPPGNEPGTMAAFPIRPEDKPVQAVLTVFSLRRDGFDADMVRLFDELAGDIAFALTMQADRQRLKLASEVFEHSHGSIIIADARGHILDVNPSFTRITGHSRREVIGHNPRLLQSGRQDRAFYEALWNSLLTKGHWAGEFWNSRKNGEHYPQRGTITAVRGEDGQIEHFISVMEDVSVQVEAEQKILNLANYDALTGLPNRLMLESRFRHAVEQAGDAPLALTVLFIDLDEFKHVNDAMGHQQGDLLLQLVSARLVGELRDGDTLARFGGDEFVVLLAGRRQEARSLAKRLIRSVRQPYRLDEQPVHIGCSIGIAQAPRDGTNLDELIQAADTAMYQAKARGRGIYAFYSSDMQHQAQNRLTLRVELDGAIQRNELRAYYQPKLGIADDGIIGFEALVRWQHPERGLVPPGNFIPVAESSGQIAAIDRWMLEAVIEQLAHWRRQGRRILPVAVNVSASLFSRSDFVDELTRWLGESRVPGHDLELEITEHVAMFDLDYTLATLQALKRLGVALSIDDFGTGYSGLAYLRDFPIDTVKIDMSFIKRVHEDEKNQGIVRAIIALADTLGLHTIAEGVETEKELAFLKRQGCWGYQGHLFSPALAADEIEHRFLALEARQGMRLDR